MSTLLDELSNVPEFTPDHQQKLIARYCSDALERIRTAPSRHEALQIVDEFCQKFDRECESQMVRKFLKQYAHSLLDHHWRERV